MIHDKRMKGERIYVCVGICVSVDKHSIQYYICYEIEIKIIIVVEYHIVISYNSSFFLQSCQVYWKKM